ncbi:hypothetical protein D3C84_576550 [compost metagenome]
MKGFSDLVQSRRLFKVAIQIALNITHQCRTMTFGRRTLQAWLAQGNRQAFQEQQVVGLGDLPTPIHVAIRLTEGLFRQQQMMKRCRGVPDTQRRYSQQTIGITGQITQRIAHVIRVDIERNMSLAHCH